MPERFLGNCPRNVAKDAKYAVRSAENGPVVSLTYNTDDDERWYMTTEGHPQLIDMVNETKIAVCGKPNGSFYINEYKQVLVPAVGSSDYYLAGTYETPLRFGFEGMTISGEPLDLERRPIRSGDEWVGPHPGIPYTLAAGGNDIYYQMTPRPDVVRKVKLSKHIGASAASAVAAQIRGVKGFQGGRFYVNEFQAIFTPLNKGGEVRYVYIGQLDPERWFEQPSSQI